MLEAQATRTASEKLVPLDTGSADDSKGFQNESLGRHSSMGSGLILVSSLEKRLGKSSAARTLSNSSSNSNLSKGL